ncbi:LOW QUALITY PROTEIN: calcium-transporting ATPase 12, plasma membrane-type-like [Punica granatum]|uniref:Calcium-transporting ATPase n=1 Tax=Punica granatum TaxID=22663 RepID=A0A6P8E3N2_PUNGR|nr:LOW QUALITY PROTEIN: calcium-transporting ATPase 12, plasma membrane-type-like [Punica granatum]
MPSLMSEYSAKWHLPAVTIYMTWAIANLTNHNSRAMSQNTISSRRRVMECSYRTQRLEWCSFAQRRWVEASSAISTSSTITATPRHLMCPVVIPLILIASSTATTMTATTTTGMATPSNNTPSSGLSLCLQCRWRIGCWNRVGFWIKLFKSLLLMCELGSKSLEAAINVGKEIMGEEKSGEQRFPNNVIFLIQGNCNQIGDIRSGDGSVVGVQDLGSKARLCSNGGGGRRRKWIGIDHNDPNTTTLNIDHNDPNTTTLSIDQANLLKAVLVKSTSFTSLSIDHNDPNTTTLNMNQVELTRLVKEKDLDWIHKLGGVEAVASALETDISAGITGDPQDVYIRQRAFGSNTWQKPPAKGLFHFVVQALKEQMILILLIQEHGVHDGWYDGGSIFVTVLLVIGIYSLRNFRQSRQLEQLSRVSDNIIQIEVVRNSRHQQVSLFDIVVGDIVCLKIGDKVPADGLFLEGHALFVDQSSMTGESDLVEVNGSSNPFLESGTKVADGWARMIVTSVGKNTVWGETMSCDNTEQTPLQVRLNMLTSTIDKVGLAVAFLLLIVLLIRYFTGTPTSENGNPQFVSGVSTADHIVKDVVGIVAVALKIIVVGIPEGLQLAVKLTLGYSRKSMMDDQAMVRKFSACETMGSATTICTHKTGILTLNQMKVAKFWVREDSVTDSGYSSVSKCILDLIREGVALNTTGSVFRGSSGSEFEFSGSPIEKALLSWAVLELNMDMEEEKQKHATLRLKAFNSQKKRSGVLLRNKADGSVHIHWKGAAEMVLAMCSSYYYASGVLRDLDDEEMRKIENVIQGMVATSLRCIAFAHKETSETQLEEDGLTLLGLVGIEDPCCPQSKGAVQACEEAGVTIKLITGDNVFTAMAVAAECGILGPGEGLFTGAVVEGGEFRNYTREERLAKVEKIRVMARSSPSDKLLMVQCLKQKGHVVAVTGDGAKDVRALKEADIGLSIGIQSTQVAKESSDLVILDDNFGSVVSALRWGRCMDNNMQKVIQFQLTLRMRLETDLNVAAVVVNFVAAVSTGHIPFITAHLLWANLIMNTLGALALATEPPTRELMEKPPVGRTEPLITKIMWRNIAAQAAYQVAVLLTLLFMGESIFNISKETNRTLIFNVFVLCQVFNEFNARKLEKKNVFEGIHRNKHFVGIIIITIALQAVMVEFLKGFANPKRLTWGQWGVCIGIGALSWPIGFSIKFIPVPEKPIFSYLKVLTKKLSVRKY